jgi:two-component system response regulator YesN
LKNLQVENFIRRKLTPGMLKVLLNQLYGTLMRVMQETSIEGEEIYKFGDRLNSLSDFYGFYDENFSFIVDSFIYICQVVNERKKNHSVKLMDEIRQFIQENYSDKNLSLLILAEKFNYSPAYLSLF